MISGFPNWTGFRVNLDFSPTTQAGADYKLRRILYSGLRLRKLRRFQRRRLCKIVRPNAYSGVYGYLQQYFDKAYKMTNGVATTQYDGHFFRLTAVSLRLNPALWHW